MRLRLHRNPVQRYKTNLNKTEGIYICKNPLQVKTRKYDQTNHCYSSHLQVIECPNKRTFSGTVESHKSAVCENEFHFPNNRWVSVAIKVTSISSPTKASIAATSA
jgi:hypothetical protein